MLAIPYLPPPFLPIKILPLEYKSDVYGIQRTISKREIANRKWAQDLNRSFTTEATEMADKHTKKKFHLINHQEKAD